MTSYTMGRGLKFARLLCLDFSVLQGKRPLRNVQIAIIILEFSFTYECQLASVVFNLPLSNASVLAGGTAMFTCRPEVNGSSFPLYFGLSDQLYNAWPVPIAKIC